MRGISADFQRLFALDAGEHHDDEASPELLKSIAARLDAKLQKHAKGSWATLPLEGPARRCAQAVLDLSSSAAAAAPTD